MSENQRLFPSISGYFAKRDVSTFDYFNDPHIEQLVTEADNAIEHGIDPLRISEGSSGSYFVRNSAGETIAVFKPRDEEPYGALNPKWTKYLQRVCCPGWCFGRSLLLLNQGYLSEAGASLVDEHLELGIVPKTRVVDLASIAFNYSPVDRYKSRTKTAMANRFPQFGRKFHRLGLPRKLGSFQLFVTDYQSSDFWLRKFDSDPLTNHVHQHFLFLFQKMVVLDYVIRNTDRGSKNWLIRYSNDPSLTNPEDIIQLAAIDNGLSFPFKHPDHLRAYPYYWAWLPIAKEPFLPEIRDLVLPKLTNTNFVEKLVEELRILFKSEPSFHRSSFEKQMAVMRGQIINLCSSLRDLGTPVDLVDMPLMTVELAHEKIPFDLTLNKRPNSQTTIQQAGDINLDQNTNNQKSSQFIGYITKYWKRPFFKNY